MILFYRPRWTENQGTGRQEWSKDQGIYIMCLTDLAVGNYMNTTSCLRLNLCANGLRMCSYGIY